MMIQYVKAVRTAAWQYRKHSGILTVILLLSFLRTSLAIPCGLWDPKGCDRESNPCPLQWKL